MKRALLALAVLLAGAGGAHAQGGGHGGHGDHGAQGQMHHEGAMLAASTPADGAILARAPRSVRLTFAHPVLLQTVSVTGPGNAPVAARFSRATTPRTAYVVALPALPAGAYAVAWRATGDGHDMQGAIRFTVR